ncbi:MAG: hypothetical protein ACKPKO_62545, partial [Candidatus Fonsibacter sp.]
KNNYFFFIHKVKNKIIKIIGNSKIKPINLFLTKKDFLEVIKYFFVKNKLIGFILLFPIILMILFFTL